jgi:hypothetical protein
MNFEGWNQVEIMAWLFTEKEEEQKLILKLVKERLDKEHLEKFT